MKAYDWLRRIRLRQTPRLCKPWEGDTALTIAAEFARRAWTRDKLERTGEAIDADRVGARNLAPRRSAPLPHPATRSVFPLHWSDNCTYMMFELPFINTQRSNLR